MMPTFLKTSARTMIVAACGVMLFVTPVLAGECAADKMKEGARKGGETVPKGVKDEVLATIDLSSKGEAFKGYMLRMRRLTIEPGGIVPWHTHDQRAANILIQEGTIIEYSSNCAGQIVHKAGDIVAEFSPTLAHWWKNESDKTVVILAGDLLPPAMPKPETM